MADVLFGRANFELATEYLYVWFGLGIEAAERLGYRVVDLPGDAFTLDNLLDALENYRFSAIFLGGHGNCYSEDTDVLTENGWKRFYQLELGEKVATLNQETNDLEYQTPTNYFKFKRKGKMFLIEGRRVNLCVTPNHKLYISWLGAEGRAYIPFRFIEAKEIGLNGFSRDPKTGQFVSTGTTMGNYIKFKRTAQWNCESKDYFILPSIQFGQWNKTIPETSVKMEDWLRFFGIWLAEGSAVPGGKHGQGYRVSIAQTNDEKRKIMKTYVDAIAEQVGFSAWEEDSNPHSKAICFKNKQICVYLKQFGHAGDKFIPQEIKRLPPHLLEILFEAMFLGDGSTYKKSGLRSYSSKSKKLADDIQEIILKIGKAATLYASKRQKLYTLHITEGDAGVTKRSQQWIDYDGDVYCVEVPNQLLYVRRGGKPCWCGNSTTLTGQDYREILKACVNDEVVSGNVAYLCSCFTGIELGPSMISKKTQAYVGYNRDFRFMINTDLSPTEDSLTSLAQPFQEIVLEIIIRILGGQSIPDIYKGGIAKCDDWIAKLYDRPEYQWSQVISFIKHNRAALIALGEREVYVEPPMPTPTPAGYLSLAASAGGGALLLALSVLL